MSGFHNYLSGSRRTERLRILGFWREVFLCGYRPFCPCVPSQSVPTTDPDHSSHHQLLPHSPLYIYILPFLSAPLPALPSPSSLCTKVRQLPLSPLYCLGTSIGGNTESTGKTFSLLSILVPEIFHKDSKRHIP